MIIREKIKGQQFVWTNENRVRIFEFFPVTKAICRYYGDLGANRTLTERVRQWGWGATLLTLKSGGRYIECSSTVEAQKMYDRFKKAATKAGFSLVLEEQVALYKQE